MKNMKMAHTANPPSVIHAVDAVDQYVATVRIFEAGGNYVASKESASSKFTQHHSGSHDFSAVHSKPFGNQKSYICAIRQFERTNTINKRIIDEKKTRCLGNTSHTENISSECSKDFQLWGTATLGKYVLRNTG